MKKTIYYLLKKIFPLDVIELLRKRVYYSMPKIAILIFILSILFFYIFIDEIKSNMALTAWFISINTVLFILLYDYLYYRLFYRRKGEVRYRNEKKRWEIKEKKLNLIFTQAPIGIFYYNKNLRILKYNNIFYRIFGLDRDLEGFDLNSINDKKVIKVMKSVLIEKESKKQINSYDFTFQDKAIWIELRCSALIDDNNNVVGGIGILEDKTKEHEAYEKLNYVSFHDALTGLPNRRYYKKFMQELIEDDRNQEYFSILFYMDLNHFKEINDTFGHSVGDKLLLEVANRFKSLKIKNRHLSRLGGDEFTLAVTFVSKSEIKTIERAKEIAYKIKELFNRVFEIEGLNLYMTSSIGIVIIEPKTDNIDTIIRHADMAMYQTKRDGQNNIKFYDHTLDLERQELTALHQDLNKAIDNGELKIYYQPIVSIKNDKLNAIEALIRWEHPTKGMIMPDKFIPMATESGLINRVGWWVANEVCRQISTWSRRGLINFEYVAININARQLHEIDFPKHIEKCIIDYKIKPSLIKLEVTETTLIDSFTKTEKIIKDLNKIGIECNIDDFGTGYSSLSYLKKLSFKVLKIDRVFVNGLLINRDNLELIKSIINIGKQFNYKVIIEGIETVAQKRKILEIDNNVSYQGFLYSKAIPAKDFEDSFLLN